jgi:hypothetical protein
MSNQTRSIATAIAGILILTFNIIDAANRGSSVWNFLAIGCGAFLLFWGFTEIARGSKPPQ